MGKESGASDAAGRAAEAQTRLAQELVQEVKPLRGGLTSDALGFVTGGRDVTGLPSYAAGKDTLEQQVQRARDAVIAGTPEGGALTSALADVERGRVGDLTQLTAGLSEAEINRGLQLATFGTAQGTQGLAGAAMTQSQRAAAEAQQNAAKSQGAGQLVGSAAGLYGLKK